jgi:hypothetical protein
VLWKMKDGKTIDIKDMTTGHLRNAIALCERAQVAAQVQLDEAWIVADMFLCSLQSENAIEAIESKLAQMPIFVTQPPVYYAMIKELATRDSLPSDFMAAIGEPYAEERRSRRKTHNRN